MKIRKLFKGEVAHRLYSSYSKKCQSIHGHSYIVEVFIEGEPTEKHDQMIIDFGEVKDKVKDFMDAWDHSMLISSRDKIYIDLVKVLEAINARYIVVPYNPTAEMIAYHMLKELNRILKDVCTVTEVIVHETATGYAKASLGDEQNVNLYNVKYSKAIKYQSEKENLFNSLG